MAQLKDLIVLGASRFIGDVYVNKLQLTSLSAPTTAGGTTYGLGTNGYVLTSNGSSIYWYPGLTLTGTAAASYVASFAGTTAASTDTDGAIRIAGGLSIKGNIISTKNTYTLGNASYPWKELWIQTQSDAHTSGIRWANSSGTYKGSINIDDSGTACFYGSGKVALRPATSGTTTGITIDSTKVEPGATNTYYLGSNSLKWKGIWLDAQSAATSEGIQWDGNTTGGAIARVGANTSGGIGIYGTDNVFIRPSLSDTTVGIKITADAITPGANKTIELGTSDAQWEALYTGAAKVTDTTDSNYSTAAGALQVSGGAYIAKKVYIADTTDSNYSTVAGSLVTAGGAYIAKKVYIANTTDSNYSTLAGSLVTAGGAYITKKVYIADGTDSNYSTVAGALVVNGGAYIKTKLYVASDVDATANTTGSLVTAGGLYVTKKIRVSDNITLTGTTAATAAINFSRSGFNYISAPADGSIAIYAKASASEVNSTIIISTSEARPGNDNTYELGTTSKRWKNIYADAALYVGSTSYTANNSTAAGSLLTPGLLHMTGATPGINFHRSTAADITGTISSTSDYGVNISGVAAATKAAVYITGTAGGTGFTYSSRTVKPILQINGITYSNSQIETATFFLTNTNSTSGSKGYYVQGNGVTYAHYYMNTVGTAGTATTFTNPEDETQTVTGYTGNTIGIAMLELGNNKAVGTNGTDYNSPGTAGNANNARGYLRLYAANSYYTDLLAQGNNNRTCYLPNYAGAMYLAHTADNAAKGSASLPVYVAANGRLTACTKGSVFSALSWTAGTTAGPTLNVTVATQARTAVIPSATGSASGVVTTDTQTFAGAKTFTGNIICDRSGTAEAQIKAVGTAGSIYLFAANTTTGYRGIYGTNNAGTGAYMFYQTQASDIYAGGKLYGAVWNDYAEYRQTNETIEPGRCIQENGNDTLRLADKRLLPGCEIVSDTFGFAIGETEQCGTPVAATGRVLAYPYEDREIFKEHIGAPVCSGPDGTVSIMTEEEEMKYPSRIIGTVSAVPDYEEWGSEAVKVNGRVWIRIR